MSADRPAQDSTSVELYQDGEGQLYLHQAGSNKVFFGFEERAAHGTNQFPKIYPFMDITF